MTMARLAVLTRIQASYLTHVVKGRAHLNSDQLDALGEVLGLTEPELEFLELMMSEERSTNERRKKKLQQRIDKLRSDSLDTKSYLSAEPVSISGEDEINYYLDPLCQLVHVFLNFPENAKDPARIAQKLGLSRERLADVLERLETAKFIERSSAAHASYRVLVRNRHLPKESPLCQPHQFLMRYKSIDQMQKLADHDRYSFSVTFSSTEEDKDAIHRAFLEFTSKAEAIVKSSQRENVYQINFDLFPWSIGE